MTRRHLSFGELHFYTCRAAFGAGLHWGLAEDAAATAIWLARHGLDPAPALARMLRGLRDGTSATTPLLDRQGHQVTLRAEAGRQLSALVAGPSAGDWWDVLAQDPAARLLVSNADAPGWVMAAIAQRRDPGELAPVDGVLDAPPGDLRVDHTCFAAAGETMADPPRHATVGAASWAVVQEFFRQSLVPSTDASRVAGAGAGLVDRD